MGASQWSLEMASVSPGDSQMPFDFAGINAQLNRARLASFLTEFENDRDVHDLLNLDVIGATAGLPLSSTGAVEGEPNLALRPFRLWEYAWLYKVVGLGCGGMSVLDLGGPASHLTVLSALCGARVTSLDVNPKYVQQGLECVSILGLEQSLHPQVGDMRDLSAFPDESFDAVISCSVLEHLPAEDQKAALREVSRVLRPGGVVGITFDFGIGAAGANEYLPPPHDPPSTAADALARFVQADLELVGNPFQEDPVAGSLFPHPTIRYTIASLFLSKPPVRAVTVPRPVPGPSRLVPELRIPQLPYRLFRSCASRQRNIPVVELERAAEERLEALQRSEVERQAIANEAARRATDIAQLTAWLQERDARIQELERAAAERLEALQRSEVERQAIANEAARRATDIAQLTAWLQERDARLPEFERAASERLELLERAGQEMQERDSQIVRLTAGLQQRDSRILELSLACNDLNRRLTETDRERRRIEEAVRTLENEGLLKYCRRRWRKSAAIVD